MAGSLIDEMEDDRDAPITTVSAFLAEHSRYTLAADLLPRRRARLAKAVEDLRAWVDVGHTQTALAVAGGRDAESMVAVAVTFETDLRLAQAALDDELVANIIRGAILKSALRRLTLADAVLL